MLSTDSFNGLLEDLGDGHVSFEAEVDGEEIEADSPAPRMLVRLEEEVRAAAKAKGEEPTDEAFDARRRALMTSLREGVEGGILGGKGRLDGEPFMWGRVDGDIGYVLITGMGIDEREELSLEEMVSEFHGRMDEILGSFEGVRAIVLDLSLNGGGTDGVSHALASHFTDKRRLAYTKGPSALPEIRHEVYIEPWTGEQFLGPVYVVSSDITASAAEIFQLCCRVLPNVQLVGTTGSKIFSDVIPKPLPNGWWLSVSAETYLTPEGECYEGLGVPVDIPLPIFEGEELGTSHRDALLGFIETLRE